MKSGFAFDIQVREKSDGPPVRLIDRHPTAYQGWEAIWYRGTRYQLFGTIRGPLFIDLSNPHNPRPRKERKMP
jgi:hypothetical protein